MGRNYDISKLQRLWTLNMYNLSYNCIVKSWKYFLKWLILLLSSLSSSYWPVCIEVFCNFDTKAFLTFIQKVDSIRPNLGTTKKNLLCCRRKIH